MAFFFATADDLLPVLLSTEAKLAVLYTPVAHLREPRADHFRTSRDLPTLFQSPTAESLVRDARYLITEADTKVVLRQISRDDGSVVWAVDQLANPDSTVLQHGGLFKGNILLRGEVRTAYKTTIAQRLQRAFDASIRKHFVKIREFYVGPAAVALLDSGGRLAASEQCPLEFDLRR